MLQSALDAISKQFQTRAHIADQLGMSQTTAHRYITTLTAAGLLERNPTSREYRLAIPA